MSAVPSSEQTSGLRLDDLLGRLPLRSRIAGDPSVRVRGVRHDSRSVVPGDLFVARKGEKADGTGFVDDAIKRGAVAVMLAASSSPSFIAAVPVVFVDDVTAALAHSAALVYGRPSEALDVIGITGTNGKTTTAHLVRAAVDAALGRAASGEAGCAPAF